MKSRAPLDWLNFFLADVKDGIGPFLAIFLLSSQHWEPGKIGVVMTIAGVATVAARTPFGALIDGIARAARHYGQHGKAADDRDSVHAPSTTAGRKRFQGGPEWNVSS